MLRLNLSTEFQNKTCLAPAKWNKKDNEYNQKWAFGYTFYPKVITPDAWVKHVLSGKAFTMASYEGNTRRKSTFVSSQIVGLDFDGNVSVADCLADSFISTHAYLIYPTPSSTPEHPKTRVMFLLDTPVTDVQQWERLQRGLLWQYQSLNPDPSCKDGARLFYGSDKEGSAILRHILPTTDLEQFAGAMEAEIGAYAEVRSAEDNSRIREQNRRNIADDKKKQLLYSYAIKTLDNMVASFPIGEGTGRNSALFKFGAKAGNMVAAGMIAYGECESALRSVAVQSGLPTHEIDNTLPRAITQGMSSPTDTDELDRRWQEKVDAWKRQQQQQPAIDHAAMKQEYADKRQAILSSAIIEFADIQAYYASDEGMDEQIRAAHAAFLRGTYRSWWHSDTENVEKPQKKIRRILADLQETQSNHGIPQGQLSAILNLNNDRSATGLVLGRMHTAFLEGRLSSAVFSIPMVSDAIGLSQRMVANAFIELAQGGYIQFLRTSSLYILLHVLYKDTLSSESDSNPYLNPHPARLYTINCDRTVLINELHHQITVKKTEEYHRRSSAQTSEQMAIDMGLSLDEYKSMQTIDKLANKDSLSKQARSELNTELNGDNKGKWRGWRYALESKAALPIDWNTCDSIRDVRGAILREWVKFNTGKRQYANGETPQAQQSRKQLCRLLGCSDATLQSIMDAYDVVSVRQNRFQEIKNPDFRDLREVTRKIIRDEGAKIWLVRFKLKGEDNWQPTKPEYAGLFYAENRANIEEIYIRYIVPSVLVLKSVASWALKWQQFIVMVAYWILTKRAKLLQIYETNPQRYAQEDISHIQMKPIVKTVKASKPQTPTLETIEAQHVYTEHTSAYIQAQLAVKVFMHTPYKLVGDCIIDGESPGGVVYQAIGTSIERRRGIAQFIITNAETKRFRPAADFFGVEVEAWDDETNAVLQEQRQNEVKALYDSLVPELDMPAENKVIQMPQPERSTPKPQPISDDRLQSFLDFCNKRQEREHGIKRPVTDWKLPTKPPVDEAWTDASGFLYEVCGDDLYVDGVKQYMTAELWNFVSRKRKSA